MVMVRWCTAIVFGWAMLICVQATGAQAGPAAEPLPPLDPGYGLYYHDSQGAPNIATRWGYHDGWEDGRHDRNHGDPLPPQNKPHYLTPIDRGMHSSMTRDQYTSAYRLAYVRGYEHGSRL
jgi:hypothetical protein